MTRRSCYGALVGAVVYALSGVLTITAAIAQTVKTTDVVTGPTFRADGPDADAYGRKEGVSRVHRADIYPRPELSCRRIQQLLHAFPVTVGQGVGDRVAALAV